MRLIYLDHNASSPPPPAVLQAVARALVDDWANPSSGHAPGQAARRLLVQSRAQVADLVGCRPAELVFTSGATEANRLALDGALARGATQGRRRLLVSAIEHPGLLAHARLLSDQGLAVERLPVRPDGRLDIDTALARLDSDVALVSVMAAHNETGVWQLDALAALAPRARALGVPLHSDATQALARGLPRFDALGVDLLSVSAHKIGGPKGVGALVVRKGLDWPAAWPGQQERGRRAGTENMPGIAGFGAAAVCAARRLAQGELDRLEGLRDRLEQGLVASLGAQPIGAAVPRLPQTTLLRVPGLHAEAALARLQAAGVAASSGAACASGHAQASHALLAMGLDAAAALEALRFSLGAGTTRDDIDAALAAAAVALGPPRGDPSIPPSRSPR
ncbi:MAG: cysteine desulfurase family protein [Rubrivivax sp.]